MPPWVCASWGQVWSCSSSDETQPGWRSSDSILVLPFPLGRVGPGLTWSQKGLARTASTGRGPGPQESLGAWLLCAALYMVRRHPGGDISVLIRLRAESRWEQKGRQTQIIVKDISTIPSPQRRKSYTVSVSFSNPACRANKDWQDSEGWSRHHHGMTPGFQGSLHTCRCLRTCCVVGTTWSRELGQEYPIP